MFNKKTTLIFLVMLLVLSIFVLAEGWAPLPPNGGDDEPPPQTPTPQAPITVQYDSTLEIIEIIAEVDGKKDTIKNSGEKISKEAKEKSDVEFEIAIKNIWDKEIKNIEVSVKIKDIDDGDDLDDDSTISKLSPGDSKKVDFEFDLPLKVDDDNYDVKIHVEGKDEDNNLHIINWVLTLAIEKDRHNVKITKASISPSILSCHRTTNLRVELLNLGRDEEEVKLEIKNEYLGINFKEKDIELDTGTDKDAEYEKTFRLNIPDNIETGTYPINIKAYYNKDKSVRTKKVNLIIEDCIQTKQKQSGVLIKTLPPSPSEMLKTYQKTKTPETFIFTTGDESIILLLTIILIVVLGLIIFLLGVIMIQLRR